MPKRVRSSNVLRPRKPRGIFAWHGIRVAISSRWCPVKVEGNQERGFALLADMRHPQLGIRWETARTDRKDPTELVQEAMIQEVGSLAAGETVPFDAGTMAGRLCIEPTPPGRDVWIGWSGDTGRVVKIIHHVRRRERILPDIILPSLCDDGAMELVGWSVFDLSCRVPRAYKLKSTLLHVGDLCLEFQAGAETLRIRQIAVAHLALRRRSLEEWLAREQQPELRYYKVIDEKGSGARNEATGKILRRRRFFFLKKMPPEMRTIAVHDDVRDKIIIVQGTDVNELRRVLGSLGWVTTACEYIDTDDSRNGYNEKDGEAVDVG